MLTVTITEKILLCKSLHKEYISYFYYNLYDYITLKILFYLLIFITNHLDLYLFTINDSFTFHDLKFILEYLNIVCIVVI